jgi:hypothetical protein
MGLFGRGGIEYIWQKDNGNGQELKEKASRSLYLKLRSRISNKG